ncbi:hypothetical protein NDA13_004889 [Ustilago tritici]|nr:hypothetical protein NDA13_004889 [Ustilago tritici]
MAIHNPAGIHPACPIATNPSTRSHSHSPGIVDQSTSTLAVHSHQSSFSSAANTICAGPTFALVASVIALGAQVDGIDSHIGRLEDTIHLNFATILTQIDSLQSSHHPPSTSTSLAAITSQPLSLTPVQTGLVFMDGQVRITKESSEQCSSSFAKAIPNIWVLAQVWLVYTAIHIQHTQDLDLNDTLLAYLEILIKFDHIYWWKGVTKYHLAICHQHFGMGVTQEWAHSDTTLQGRILLTNFRTPTVPSSSTPSSKPGAKPPRPGCTTVNPPPVKICSTPPAHPNTTCKLLIFDRSDTPTTVGSLKLEHWAPFLDLYPDQDFTNQLRGALCHGTLLGYSGPLHDNARLEVLNLPMDLDDELHLPGAHLPSVNNGIHHLFVSIHYKNLDTVIDFICKHQGASLWKADLKDTFRHVIVAEGNARLMGIQFDRLYYQEYALAFNGRSSPFLFNLFTKFLHWVMSFAL